MSFAILFLNLIPVVLGGIPGLPVNFKQIITDVTSGISAIFASGAVTQPSVNAALAAWAGVISALKNDPTLSPGALNSLAQLEKAVQSALVEDAIAAKSVDWTQINPIAAKA